MNETVEMLAVAAVLAAVFVLFVKERISSEQAARAGLAALLVTGVLGSVASVVIPRFGPF